MGAANSKGKARVDKKRRRSNRTDQGAHAWASESRSKKKVIGRKAARNDLPMEEPQATGGGREKRGAHEALYNWGLSRSRKETADTAVKTGKRKEPRAGAIAVKCAPITPNLKGGAEKGNGAPTRGWCDKRNNRFNINDQGQGCTEGCAQRIHGRKGKQNALETKSSLQKIQGARRRRDRKGRGRQSAKNSNRRGEKQEGSIYLRKWNEYRHGGKECHLT